MMCCHSINEKTEEVERWCFYRVKTIKRTFKVKVGGEPGAKMFKSEVECWEHSDEEEGRFNDSSFLVD